MTFRLSGCPFSSLWLFSCPFEMWFSFLHPHINSKRAKSQRAFDDFLSYFSTFRKTSMQVAQTLSVQPHTKSPSAPGVRNRGVRFSRKPIRWRSRGPFCRCRCRSLFPSAALPRCRSRQWCRSWWRRHGYCSRLSEVWLHSCPCGTPGHGR